MTGVQVRGVKERGPLHDLGASDLMACWPGCVGLAGQGQVCVPELGLSRSRARTESKRRGLAHGGHVLPGGLGEWAGYGWVQSEGCCLYLQGEGWGVQRQGSLTVRSQETGGAGAVMEGRGGGALGGREGESQRDALQGSWGVVGSFLLCGNSPVPTWLQMSLCPQPASHRAASSQVLRDQVNAVRVPLMLVALLWHFFQAVSFQ